MDYFFIILADIVTALISAFVGSKITLVLTDRKERREAQSRFKNRMMLVAYELYNFEFAAGREYELLIEALRNLVYYEPLIHQDQSLFDKAQKTLNLVQFVDSSTLSKTENAMKDLSDYLLQKYGIKVSE